MELARVPWGYLSCRLLPGKLMQSSQSIPAIHHTPLKRPPGSWARDTAWTSSACSWAGQPQCLCFLRSKEEAARDNTHAKSKAPASLDFWLKKQRARTQLNHSSITLIRLYQGLSATKNTIWAPQIKTAYAGRWLSGHKMNQSSGSVKPVGACCKPRRYSMFSSATSEVGIWPAGLLSSKS